jgi:hypothetical protein
LTSSSSFPRDPQEPFRWIADMAVMEAFESGVLDLLDFYFTGDDYRHRFEPEAKQQFLDLLRERFNAGVRYGNRLLKWDTIIEQKAVELAGHPIGRSTKPDFSQPAPPRLPVKDEPKKFRRRILSLTQSEAEKLRMGKSTLHNLRSRARNPCSLKIYAPVRKRLVWKEN